MSGRLIDDVLACIDRGWYVTALCWPDEHGRCACPKHHTNPKEIGKAPLLGNGYQDHPLSREETLELWTRYPQANYGILLKPSLLFVLDADSLDADHEIENLGTPPGPRVRRDDHIHRYFCNTAGVVGRAIHTGQSGKIDILSDGYVVGPGSLHSCGSRYVCEVPFDQVALDDPPQWAIKRLHQSREYGDCEEIPADLPPINVDTLRVPRVMKALIRCGPAIDPARYPSRSEAVFAVLTALLKAGYSDVTTLASILLDPRNAIRACYELLGCQRIFYGFSHDNQAP